MIPSVFSVLDTNLYRDAETLEKEFVLQGKCRLHRITFCGVSWETDDNGFVIKASSKQMQMEYRYDNRGIRWVKPKVDDKTLSVSATP
ncbi:YnfC family lipoprotein [Shigella sonnei]